ncbi:vacuolar protein sorting/targeting protein PEP1 [Geranomyces michiganensis]|nr:vacuolar protein sorting/targeting protein PEP1 [Geranomyces michiganensis]
MDELQFRCNSLVSRRYRPPIANRRFLLVALVCLCILTIATPAFADDKPLVSKPHDLEHGAQGIFYFGETKNILLWEAGSSRAVLHSDDEGLTWNPVKEIPAGSVVVKVIQHPFALATTAIILTSSTKHFITTNAGKSWSDFETPLPPAVNPQSIGFNAKSEEKMLFAGLKCQGEGWNRVCHNEHFYTSDGFKSKPAPLLKYTLDCVWASASAKFAAADPSTIDPNTIFCAQWPEDMQHDDGRPRDQTAARLVSSASFFPEGKGDVHLLGGGIIGLGVVERFMFAAVVANDKSEGMSFFSSTDGKTFRKAQFPFGSSLRKEGAYTVLESSEASLAVDLATKDDFGRLARWGTLFFSDGDGDQFVKAANLDATNRGLSGRVDFERIQAPNFEGIYLANVVSNWQELDPSAAESDKHLVTKMSFGGAWAVLTPPEKNNEGNSWPCTPSGAHDPKCALHLHSVTEPHNIGRVFSTGGAPGILLGVGSVGAYLRKYEESDTFMSTDAGRTWKCVAKGPHKYESLDSGSVIALIPDNGPTSHILYSIDHGASPWKQLDFKIDDKPWTARATILDPESTSSKILLATENAAGKMTITQIDFAPVFSRKCSIDASKPQPNDDFELWTPTDDAGKPKCFLGQTSRFLRRKPTAACSASLVFTLPDPQITPCDCGIQDYECDVQYQRAESSNDNKLVCELAPGTPATFDQPPNCPKGTKYQGKSGFRKVPGNKCVKDLDAYKPEAEKTCVEVMQPGEIVVPPKGHEPAPVKATVIKAKIASVLYFRKSPVMVALTTTGSLYRSKDEGANWDLMWDSSKLHGPILGMGLHETADNRAFFFANTDTYFTEDALATEPQKLNTPGPYNGLGLDILDFHPDKPDWYVFLGGARDCATKDAKCHTEAFWTKDNGKTWSSVETWANKCIWARDVNFKNPAIAEDAIFCTSFRYKNSAVGQDELIRGAAGGADAANAIQLVEILPSDGNKKRVLVAQGARNYYVVAGVLVVAVEVGENLSLMVSTDGVKFEETHYPPEANVAKNAFTLLQSSTSVFVDAGQDVGGRLLYGTLYKSNGEGNYFSHILSNTNREGGSVDFERMQGVGGVIVANQVLNPAEAARKEKKIGTVISFDDGGKWAPIPPPKTNYLGKPFTCTGNDCALHLYSHTASASAVRHVSSEMHSTARAAGVMVAVGNVGQSLDQYRECNVFVTRDSGRTWNEAFKDAHRWAIGNAGGLIVIVNDEGPTTVARYSWDFGKSWATITFAERPIRVSMISTHPSATSLKFTITGTSGVGSSPWPSVHDETVVVHLDFSPVLSDKCDKDKDFETLHDPEGTCFLGRKISYLRRKQGSFCHVAADDESVGEVKGEKCACSDADYECDFGFFKDGNECKLTGKDPKQPENCPKGTTFEGSSGYRKISASECTGAVASKEKPQARTCNADVQTGGGISVAETVLDDKFKDYFYFNPTTVMMQTKALSFLLSSDGGMNWKTLTELKDATTMASDLWHEGRAWFVTTGKKLIYTEDSGTTFVSLDLPEAVARGMDSAAALHPHPKQKSWLLWHGRTDGCTTDDECVTSAWVSQNLGAKWTPVRSHVMKCEWGVDAVGDKGRGDAVVFCVDRVEKTGGSRQGNMQLIRTADVRKDKPEFTVVLDRVSDFVVYGEYIIAIMRHDNINSGKVHVSVDGNEWAQARFPVDNKATGYTVLESSTGTIFLATLDSRTKHREYGTLYTSNGNGTFYTKSIDAINMNSHGNADFEKMQGIEGIALLNRLSNAEKVNSGATKLKQSRITFNDGVEWDFLTRPASDGGGKPYACSGESPENCALHLHSYTSRNDIRDQFSASAAVGMMLGVGSVGPSLAQYRDSDTFLTRNAGRNWTEISKHPHKWEFGDRGGILFLVNDKEPTDHIKYSLDMGHTFQDLSIVAKLGAGAKLSVDRVFSEPGGTGTAFVIVGTLHSDSHALSNSVHAVTVDFQKVFSRQCDKDKDFETWSPSGIDGGDGNSACLFGQTVEYTRRRSDVQCLVGTATRPKVAAAPCACTPHDYECGYNYEPVLDPSGRRTACALVAGLTPSAPICAADGTLRESTPYVKMAKSHCVGGVALDLGKHVGYCGSKAQRSLGFFAWVGIILASVGSAAAITAAFIRFRGKLFGRIRLPVDEFDGDPGSPLFGRAGQPPAERAAHAAKSLLIILVGVAEAVSSKAVSLWDTIVRGRRRGEGYAPVGEYDTPRGGRSGGSGEGLAFTADDDALLGFDDY